ncbi:MAG: GTPase ObgE [Deltaproteobacteria bacterium]|nr:GTPase ObgE [Deltaproteobacteria bacterium]
MAGNGGNGCCAFRREKYNPKGGPSGGDGGKGGDIIIEATQRASTLLDFRYKKHYKARSGTHGQGNDRYGAGGEDLILKVPVGTTIIDDESNKILGDLIEDGETLIAAHGGVGGWGNIHFVSPSNQAPRKCIAGEKGEAKNLRLELKLLAQAGLLGLPNAGKSTLLSSVSAARPKIANYPFTTLIPNLGVVQIDGERNFVMADIPGLVEGAHQGRGLGHRFLKHLERTRVLVHLIEFPLDPKFGNPWEDFSTLSEELEKYDPKLAELPRIVVLSKIDLCNEPAKIEELREQFEGYEFYPISAVTKKGIKPLMEAVWRKVN